MTAGGVAILGVVLLVLGLVLNAPVIWYLGIAALVVALIVLLVAGHRRRRDRL